MSAGGSSKSGHDTQSRLAGQVRSGDRRALAKAITLIESTRADHRARAAELIAALLPHTGDSVRLGITGVPGVGKSTFIEAFGLHLIEAGHRVAVLAIDPSSKRGGGSILGDKTRMESLARNAAAYIRPTPTGGTLGGVARRTREAMLACEAAGFDVVIVETVGVGQSETAVADMVDMFLLLLTPAGGDELQGLKKGIVELADMLVVNKADGDLAAAAGRTAGEYRAALHILKPTVPGWTPPVLQCSALDGTGIGKIWQEIEKFRETLSASGDLAARRRRQARAWMWSEVSDSLMAAFRRHPGVERQVAKMEASVTAGEIAPGTAAEALIRAFLGGEST